jgi:hypothetical protein
MLFLQQVRSFDVSRAIGRSQLFQDMHAVDRTPGPIAARGRGASHHLYQLEYHMKITMKSRLLTPSVAAAAVLAFWLTGAQLVRAEEALAPPGQDMVLVPMKVVETLEQRVLFLEETVAALTESWQHIDTHRLCVSDESSETCITKSQLDYLLARLSQAEAGQPAVSQPPAASQPAASQQASAATDTPTQAVEIAATSPQPATAVGESSPRDEEPEITATVKPAITGAALLSYPKVEIYEDPDAQTDN